ncbi:twin-arginine translocase subunit TatB [Peteryoungia desertarenae]|uniref:Sec-independent protein translocase protein TatB n=1 Tax=Peteryoungia desertarenae TaxID=1813451 RepID=A0ABX6QP54_9HYPH|nr:Sec-independent protein translocase protein TatB [Peteryoungia desertarenae]QLF70295.1 twin-arginine translocase subunit TatB [Peteryoungia desertarenae]
MLDIGWTELLVVSVILIVVVGPKDLPPMLRAFGKMTTRLRKTAGEFRAQFDEALREAELDDIRNTVNDVKKLNPAESLREAINPLRQMTEDIKSDLHRATRLESPAESEAEPENSILPDISDLATEPPAELRPAAPVSSQTGQAPASSAPAATTAPPVVQQTAANVPGDTSVGAPVAAAPEAKVANTKAPKSPAKKADASPGGKSVAAKPAKAKSGTVASDVTDAVKAAPSKPRAAAAKPKAAVAKTKVAKPAEPAAKAPAPSTRTRKAKSEDRA